MVVEYSNYIFTQLELSNSNVSINIVGAHTLGHVQYGISVLANSRQRQSREITVLKEIHIHISPCLSNRILGTTTTTVHREQQQNLFQGKCSFPLNLTINLISHVRFCRHMKLDLSFHGPKMRLYFLDIILIYSWV